MKNDSEKSNKNKCFCLFELKKTVTNTSNSWSNSWQSFAVFCHQLAVQVRGVE